MNRWAGLAIATVTGVLLFLPRTGGAPSGDQLEAAHIRTEPSGSVQSTVPADTIILEHQLIEIDPPRPRAAPVRRTATPRQTMDARRPRPEPGFMVRAGRLLIGDGRHRPEPFPTPPAAR